ncbi:hypothetical protein MP228_000156 [Amoeboaphelidium protococcarum]|nr:hypothetical protein MP228_000156 [Amoeboaphelidium protococcarum]
MQIGPDLTELTLEAHRFNGEASFHKHAIELMALLDCSNNALVVALTRCGRSECPSLLIMVLSQVLVSLQHPNDVTMSLLLSAVVCRFSDLISIIPLSKVATLRRFKTLVSTSTIIYGAQKIWPNGPQWYHGPQHLGATGPELTAW